MTEKFINNNQYGKHKLIALGLLCAVLLLSVSGKSEAARIYNHTGETVKACKGVGVLGKVAAGGQCETIAHGERSKSLQWNRTNGILVKNKANQIICSLDFGVHAQIQGGNYMQIYSNKCTVYSASHKIISTGSLLAYPYVKIKNESEYRASGTIEYGPFGCSDDSYSVAPGETWHAKSRGACLVTSISSKLHGSSKYGENTKVVPYDSTTSYSEFQISSYGGSYRVFSKEEFADVTDTKREKSPGFYFVNKTPWPVAYSLDQYSCLHHGIVPARSDEKDGLLKVDTGAVWFTLEMQVQPDGVDPKDDFEDCALPVVELVGDIALAVFTGGSSATAKTAAKTSAKIIAKEAAKKFAKKQAKKLLKTLVKDFTKKELGKLFALGTNVELYGQYAGYEWPFRCKSMPEYHITGGPYLIDENGERYLSRGTPFTITKVNTCGDDMMLASRKKDVADQGIFAKLPFAKEAADKVNKVDPKVYFTNEFRHFKNHSITGYNDRVLSNLTRYQCMSKCKQEKSFSCKSFDYGNKTQTCYLSTKSGIEKPNDGTYDYYQLEK
ncbi:PAN/Apple domain-containing protein [Glaciecola petra]|uniref:PAN/Apple domain-containing protein n=1 Tax=Glaciecola petra TaxID=3075602 RepID=A0ABU2ZVU9_9ALTE|nr:PAN/Apple domain-containing protein [Aestuariibacter sp. P117]MDT0596366.1 PAN/Apple domain-containing protein [Aestuariibacter sp. P117]